MNLITTPAQVGYTPAATAIVHSTTASLTSRAPVQPVHLVQYDQTVPIVAVSLTANGQPYTVPSGAAVNVRMKKPDGTYVYNPALGVSSDSQTAYIGITAQMTAANGNSGPVVEIVVDDGVVGTAAFPVIIDPNPVPDSAYESTDEYLTLYEILQQAQSAAQVVQQYGGVLTTISDNIDTVLAVPDAAQQAAASAAAAQQAAQEALGFRTFFSAVTPDENGDLDPSRPMATPTAASVTVKSKGDRIQSVQVNGFTTQAGSGDASPDNVISAAGYNKKYQVPASGWSKDSANPSVFYNDAYLITDVNEAVAIVSNLAKNIGQNFQNLSSFVSASSNFSYAIGFGLSGTVVPGRMYVKAPFSSAGDLQNWITANNGFLLYVTSDTSKATGLYIPIQAHGHEYRCKMMELTAPLCDGDKVESCVPSGCDKTITIDGSTVAVTASGSNYVVTAADAAAGGNAYTEDLAYLSLTAGQIAIPAASFPASVTSAQTANAWLQSNPQKVWYQSTAYTEANDIPVQLEEHSHSAGTPVTIVYKLATPAIYAHDPVTLVAVPYTQADVDAANQLANTPSTLPAIDSPDVPMLLNSADNTDSAAQVMALAANAVPVAGTYVVSSQDGTTVLVSLKAMQDGGDAATLGGMTLDDIKQLISDMIAAANGS